MYCIIEYTLVYCIPKLLHRYLIATGNRNGYTVCKMAAEVPSSKQGLSDCHASDVQANAYSIFKDPRYRVLFSILKGFRNGAV